MTFDAQQLATILDRLPQPRRWLVGFSGGLDSTVLLHALVAAKSTIPVVAIHVNHGLSSRAEQWQQHCEALAAQWRVELICENVEVSNRGRGIENAAREARFAIFERHVQTGDVLLLAHHLADQAETLLYRLLRGTGPRGLGGMQPCRQFHRGHIARPLLEFSRRRIADYAETNQLTWIDDDSNQQHVFDRNYLRHRVMPALAERWPDFQQRWSQSATLCREAEQLNEDLAALDLSACGERIERLGHSVKLAALAQLAPYRRRNMLRYWLRCHYAAVPEQQHLQEIERQFFSQSVPSADRSSAKVAWGTTELRCFAERLYLLPRLPDSDSSVELIWDGIDTPLTLPDGSSLSTQSGGQLLLPSAPVEIRWRQGGERCQPHRRAHSQTLKKLLQEYQLEPWLRDRVPLVYCGGRLAAVGDLWVCKDFVAQSHQTALSLAWSYVPQAQVDT